MTSKELGISSELYDKKITVICVDGQRISGILDGWTSAADNEPDGESITLLVENESPTEIMIDEIAEIKVV